MVVGPTLRVQPYSIAHLASSLHLIHCPLCVVIDSNGVYGAHTDQCALVHPDECSGTMESGHGWLVVQKWVLIVFVFVVVQVRVGGGGSAAISQIK